VLPVTRKEYALLELALRARRSDLGRRVLRNVSTYAMIRAASAALSFVGIAVLTRLLDRAEYGRYALIAATASFAGALGFTWLRMGLLRYLPSFDGRREVFL